LAWLINTCHHASEYGITTDVARGMGYFRELDAAIESMKALRRRDVRILPGGDYGFAWTPHGTNAKDLEYFVKYVGMSTMEALLSATAWGGPMMRMGKDQLGKIQDGYLADLLLIDGDPLADITVLQDKSRILAVMKDGEFHRAPPMRSAARPATATRWAA
jgi:imidazolonepropionase-like amidohydrolase